MDSLKLMAPGDLKIELKYWKDMLRTHEDDIKKTQEKIREYEYENIFSFLKSLNVDFLHEDHETRQILTILSHKEIHFRKKPRNTIKE